ncbi:MAG: hypothetical protein WCP06_11770 [Verrucomicrobiota bacterium]
MPPRTKMRMERLLLPLKSITDNFSDQQRPALAKSPDASVIVAVPVDPVIQQLSCGRVFITIADLKRIAPVGIFSSDTSHDQERVEISLRDILAKLDSSLLKRRTQRLTVLPDDFADLFRKKGGAPESEVALDVEANNAPAVAESAMETASTPVASAAPVAPAEVQPEVAAPPSQTEPAPVAPRTVAAPSELHALFSAPRREEPAATEVVVEPSGLKLNTGSNEPLSPEPEPIRVEELPDPGFKLSFMPPKPTVEEPAPVPPPWEEKAKLRIAPDGGRHGESEVEAAFPGEDGETETPAEPSPCPSAPVQPVLTPEPPPLPQAQKPPAPASQLVVRACGLKGVAGAVIALKDGMLVEANVPSEFNPETLAAFLPQVFARVEQATGAMEIGLLQTVMFTAGDRPWQIWDAGSVYFAALGRPNELLPGSQLKVIAAQLTRQSK